MSWHPKLPAQRRVDQVVIRAHRDQVRIPRVLVVFAVSVCCAAPGAGVAAAATGGVVPAPVLPAGTGAFAPFHAVARGPVSPYDGNGMWIWQVPRSDGGNISRIVARARRRKIGTVYVKSGDGANVWRQFTPALVAAFHRAGIKVCGWQYVYGRDPLAEAAVAAVAKSRGADCFVIDAESEYEGRYVQAQTYVQELRRRVGSRFPVGLAPFPYVDYHPAFPYSVLLASGAASFDLPQMYWKAIGVRVDTVFRHTFRFAALFGRPVYPLGQTYESPQPAEITRFRQLSSAYGASGLSWWDWQESLEPLWRAVGAQIQRPADVMPDYTYPTYGPGSKGDVVVEAQQRLRTFGALVPVDGYYGAATRDGVKALQTAKSLVATGVLDDQTWTALLGYRPAAVRWVARGSKAVALAASPASATALVPRSAGLPARRDEIPARGRG